MTDLDGTTCSRCGAPLPADGPAGLCPLCLPPDTRNDQTEIPPGRSSSREGSRRKRTLASALAAVRAFLLGGLWIGNRRVQQPDDAKAHYIRGIELHRRGKLAEAIAEYRTAIRLNPDDAAAHNNFGLALQSRGSWTRRSPNYRAAIRLKPDHAEAHYNLGIALDSPGEAGRGDRRIPRGDPAQARLRRGPLQPRHRPEDQGKLDEAIAEFRAAIRLKPDYAEAHINLGIALQDQGKLEEAIAEYRAAIRLKPDYAEAHYNLGLALKPRGSWRRRSPNTARRSGSSPTTPRPTSTSASP